MAIKERTMSKGRKGNKEVKKTKKKPAPVVPAGTPPPAG